MDSQQFDDFQTVKTKGKKPKTIHVAHRRSPSELTTLMLEQLSLQRQLEIVQAQQQQILQQQQGQPQYNQHQHGSSNNNSYSYQNILQSPANLNNNRGHHRRSSSNNYNENNADNQYSSPKTHRRSQSSINSIGNIPFSKNDSRPQALGHTRRHSLGLAEAKKAAAEAQAQRYNSPSKLSISDPISNNAGNTNDHSAPEALSPPVFRFPGSPKLSPADELNSMGTERCHTRSRSNLSDKTSPQKAFQFPPTINTPSTSSQGQTLQPPQPAFAERKQSAPLGHKATGSDLSSNWRKSSTPMTPSNSLNVPTDSPGNFVPGHRSKNSFGGGSSISSISQFNGQSQRKSLFAPYLPQSSLPELINEGKLVTGILRVNKKNRSDAYVSTDGLLDADIFICGSKDRNRALEGDVVAVELLVVDEVWSSKREKEEKKRRKDTKFGNEITEDIHNDASTSSTVSDPNSTFNSTSTTLQRKNSLKQRPIQKKNDDVEVEGQSLLLVEEEEITDEAKPLYAGHVVAVIDRIPGQLFSGTLGLLRPSQAAKREKDKEDGANDTHSDRPKPKIVWFKPIDKKVPLIAIPTEQAPKDFIENHDKYANQTFIASIKRWPITSLHPFGTLVSRLGPTDDKSVEVESILRDNNFMCDEYIDGEEKYMLDFPTTEYILSRKERRNFDDEYIIACSQNKQFSDHAFHVKGTVDNKIELGFHILDVSEYVLNDNNLDRRAKKRSHGVFLPQKSVNLFPDHINNLISFKENTVAPALSVIFEIDSTTFEIENIWIGETAITPTKRVSYAEIDEVFVNKGTESQSSDAITTYFSSLSLISEGLKRKRLNDQSLNANVMLPLLDQLDDERVKLSLNIYENIVSAHIIDEIFHTVNAAVAQKVHSAIGDRALLRRFPMPTLNKFEYYQAKIAEIGVTLDTSNAGSFQKSILDIDDQVKREAVETILVKCMGRGKYVIAGKTEQDLGHYLFNLTTYTHFNAPLKRYSDIIVHRQLKHVINNTIDDYNDDIDALKVVADYCNFKTDCAIATQEQAIHLLLCQTINDMSSKTGQVLCTGIVLQVYESAFDVYLPEFGIEKRVHGDQLPLSKAEFDRNQKILRLFWEPNVDSSTYIPADENEPLSYRSSIKNKFRASSINAAKNQDDLKNNKSGLLSDEMYHKLSKLNLQPPKVDIKLPADGESSLDPYIKDLDTFIEGDNHIQEIKLLSQIPILLRAEIGMSLPCLTVRALNPFLTQATEN